MSYSISWSRVSTVGVCGALFSLLSIDDLAAQPDSDAAIPGNAPARALLEEKEEKKDQREEPEPDAAEQDICDAGFMNLKILPDHCYENQKKFEYAILPGVFVQKETSLGFGLYLESSFYIDKSDEKTQASRASLAGAYTLNQQYLIKFTSLFNFKGNDWVLDGFADFRHYPNRYYGIGNDTSWDYQVYSEDVLSFFYEGRRRIWDNLYLGLVWNLRATTAFSEEQAITADGEESDDPTLEKLTNDDPLGTSRNLSQGLGGEIAYDSRDNVVYPHRGGYYRSWLVGYGPHLGGDFSYINWTVDARHYFTTWPKQVLALQILSEFRSGEVPFSSMSELGGPFQMRGYFKGRYRDRNMLLMQAEYRFPIVWRLSGTVFADLGEVYGNEPFDLKLLRWTAGAGLRFLFGKQTYVRLDLGASSETVAFIFNGGQAF